MNIKRSQSKGSRFYLALDRYMSGDFKKLFLIAFGCSLVLFLVVWGLGYWCAHWDWIDTLIQMSNPAKDEAVARPWEWVPILLANVFGLVVLNGVILTLFVNWLSGRKEQHTNGEARYDYIFSRPYSVIVGGHKIVAALARDLLAGKRNEYILIQTQRDADKVRKEVYACIKDESLARNVIIYSGSRTSWHELEELHLDSAREVYIIGEPSRIDGSSHDAINLQCWELICDNITDKREAKIPCHVMFEYQSTFSAFQFTDLKLEHCGTFRFIPFSIYENWAQQVLLSRCVDGEPLYMPLDGPSGLQESSHRRVHLIVVGMSKMGMALAVEAAHLAHYPNFNNPHAGRPRTLITFIDRDARREMLFMMGRFRELFRLARWRYLKAPDGIVCPAGDEWDIYESSSGMNRRVRNGDKGRYPWHDPLHDAECRSPYYGGYLGEDFIDIDFEFIEGDVSLPSVQKYIADACADNSAATARYNATHPDPVADASSRTTIAVCLPVAVEAMSAALYFDPSVYDNVQQIWVQQNESGALVDTIRFGLTGQDNARFRTLRPFGMFDKCDYFVRIESIMPRLVAYAYNCLDNGTSLAECWNKARSPEEFHKAVDQHWISISQDGGKSSIAKRWSNIYSANSYESKIRCAGIDLADAGVLRDSATIGILAKVEHNRWVMEQLLLGVRPVDNSFAGKLPIEDKALRKKLKGANVHPDLISNEMLGSTQLYDEEIVKIIPLAYHIARQLAEKSAKK